MPTKNMKMYQRRFAHVLILVIIAILVIVGYFSFKNSSLKSPQPTTTNEMVSDEQLLKFTSKNEGFSLFYPQSWKLQDTSSGNCGNEEVKGSTCRERFEFVSPDGLLVRYVEYSTLVPGKSGCGKQSDCWIDVVSEITDFNVPELGKVYLVKLQKNDQQDAPEGYYYMSNNGIYLHMPTSSETMPKVGKNVFKDYAIDYSLPSKIGGRFSIFVSNISNRSDYFEKLSAEDYFNLPSVKKAEKILKSISY